MNNLTIGDIIQRAQENRAWRIHMVTKSFYLFMKIYFSKEMSAPGAPFQKEICDLAQTEKSILAIASFRGSGKSLFITQGYALWAALTQGNHLIFIVGETQTAAGEHLGNIKSSLENNELLRKDFGLAKKPSDRWSGDSLVISSCDTKIRAVSIGQKIRGTKYKQWRPTLVIADDIQDINSVRNQEARNKNFNYLQSELIKIGAVGMQLIVVGNLLHQDSSIMRLMAAIEKGKIRGTCRKYPLIDVDGNNAWPQYFTPEVIAAERAKVLDPITWELEMNLKFVSTIEVVVKREWITTYSTRPDGAYVTKFVIGVDPAISERQTADYTAIVTGIVCNSGEETKLYVYPNPLNKRLDFPETVDEIRARYDHLSASRPVEIVIENVAYQRALPQQLEKMHGLPAEGFKIGLGKRARFSILGYLIRAGKIVFPETGCEALINQLVNFGGGEHDDLCDALALIAFKEFPDPFPKFTIPGAGYMGTPLDAGDMTNGDFLAMLSDPEKRAELEREADFKLADEQLVARGAPLDLLRKIQWRRRNNKEDSQRQFTF